jgi:hypothetical protein
MEMAQPRTDAPIRVMNMLQHFSTALILSAFTIAAPTDTLMVRRFHTDAYTMGPTTIPASDATETIWFTKNRTRLDFNGGSMLLVNDQKKLYMIDPKAKKYSAIDMPFDITRNLPPEGVAMYEKAKRAKVMSFTTTATEETKKIGEWNTKKYQLSMKGAMFGDMTEDLWTTKEIAIDPSIFTEVRRFQSMMMPDAEALDAELKKIDGVPIVSDQTRTVGTTVVKMHDELVSIERKDAPPGTFEVPKEFVEEPFPPAGAGAGPSTRDTRGAESPKK